MPKSSKYTINMAGIHGHRGIRAVYPPTPLKKNCRRRRQKMIHSLLNHHHSPTSSSTLSPLTSTTTLDLLGELTIIFFFSIIAGCWTWCLTLAILGGRDLTLRTDSSALAKARRLLIPGTESWIEEETFSKKISKATIEFVSLHYPKKKKNKKDELF